MNFEKQFDGTKAPREEKKESSPREGLRPLMDLEKSELREDLLKKRQAFLDSRE